VHNKSNSREREREREQKSDILNQIQQYFATNNIKSITLKDNRELLIEYQQGNSETASADSSELQQIQAYCQAKNLNTLSFADLQQTQSNSFN
jgi:cytochrome c